MMEKRGVVECPLEKEAQEKARKEMEAAEKKRKRKKETDDGKEAGGNR